MTRQTKSSEGQGRKWWQSDSAASEAAPLPHEGQACPKCYMADLIYDSLFRLHCPLCGFVAACGAFT